MSQNNQKNGSDNGRNNKYLITAGIVILVVIALAIAAPHFKKGGKAPAAPATTATTDTSTVTPVTKPADGGQAAWDAVLAQYSGRVIVFGADCAATPTDHVQALGSTMLLANNSGVDHKISVGGGSAMSIGAHHYKTVKITTSSTQVVSCDAVQKAATVTVK